MINLKRISSFLLITIFSFSLFSMVDNTKSKAVTASDWKPGRIIDDAVFFNKDAMSPAQIQQFLNSKVPVCNTNFNRSFWLYGHWNSPPWTCIKDYQENGKSAAQIIWEAGQRHGINPQVLIITLQKETAIITDTWAAPWQYKRATGYLCPDSKLGTDVDANQNGCYDSHESFTAQINGAAWQLKRYTQFPDSFNFKAGVTRNILWSPNGACGSSPVYIETQGTAALYNYTPYQPNAAALNNMYGTGDSCSTYGNRNFWRMFNDWFGSTYSGIAKYQTFQHAHPTGALVRDWAGGVVYKIIDGYRLRIPNYSAFLSHNYSDSSIKIMNYGDTTLPISTKYLGYRSGTLIRESGDPKIYVIQCTTQYLDSCSKRHIADYETFVYLDYSEKDVRNVVRGELSSITVGSPISGRVAHPDGTLISNPSNGKIYLIKNGKKHHVTTGLLFELNRYEWAKVKLVNDQDIALPESLTFPEYDTNLLAKAIGDPRIYAIGENGYGTTYKKHISSYETFQLLGYSEKDVRLLEPSILNSYVSIPPYPY